MPPDNQKKSVDILIGHGLIASETISAELRERLVNRLAAKRNTLGQTELLQFARQVLSEFEPLLADTLFDAEISAWVAGVAFVAEKMPAAIVPSLSGNSNQPPFEIARVNLGESDEPFLRLPMIERAAQILKDRRVVTKAEFDQLSAEAKQQAFTVARVNSDATIEKMRDVLADLVAKGPTLKDFKLRLADELETSQIGPGHAEVIYRTNVQSAYMQGHDDLANNRIVEEVFPFSEYLPIHDRRCRPEHLALGRLGLSETGVYWTKDEFWRVFQIPWAWSCRCGKNSLTVEAAARKGVAVAQEWLRTGIKPTMESRLTFIPFRPDPKFRQTVLAA